jgi:dUTP pyrophosphatase
MKVKFFTADGQNLFEGEDHNAGYDLKAAHNCRIPNFGRALIMTGIYTCFDKSMQLEIRSRSGLALKSGIMVLNSPGTIDSSYRGEIGVILFNVSGSTFDVNKGDRIAQAVFMPVIHPKFQRVSDPLDLDDSERGELGFGSSGV